MDNMPCPFGFTFQITGTVRFIYPPPRGVTVLTAVQKGKTMPADVVFAWTPDTDPNAVQTVTTVSVNGAQVGSITLPNATSTFNYSQLTPAPPTLNVGDVVTASSVTTDNQTPPLSSPPIPFPSVTIAAAQPAPTGITNPSAKQVGSPS